MIKIVNMSSSSLYPIEQWGRFVVEIEGRLEVVLEQQRSLVEIECKHDFRLETTPSRIPWRLHKLYLDLPQSYLVFALNNTKSAMAYPRNTGGPPQIFIEKKIILLELTFWFCRFESREWRFLLFSISLHLF